MILYYKSREILYQYYKSHENLYKYYKSRESVQVLQVMRTTSEHAMKSKITSENHNHHSAKLYQKPYQLSLALCCIMVILA